MKKKLLLMTILSLSALALTACTKTKEMAEPRNENIVEEMDNYGINNSISFEVTENDIWATENGDEIKVKISDEDLIKTVFFISPTGNEYYYDTSDKTEESMVIDGNNAEFTINGETGEWLAYYESDDNNVDLELLPNPDVE